MLLNKTHNKRSNLKQQAMALKTLAVQVLRAL